MLVHQGDLTDLDHVRGLMHDVDPSEVYNLAAISSVALSWSEPDLTARVNGLGAAGLLESALAVQEKRGHPVRFVQASSAEMFGEPATSPQDESTALRPVNPYGAAKAFAHLAVGVYRQRDLHAVSVILYNHESPRRPAQFVTRRITSTVAAIARGRADRLVLGNLESRRDWGWAPDYVDALVRAARAERADDYVIATGEGHSVREFAAAAFARAGVADWEPLLESDPALFRPADATDLDRRRQQGPPRARLVTRPSTSPRSSAGWSTPTSPCSRRLADRRRRQGPPRARLVTHRRLRRGRRSDGRRRPRSPRRLTLVGGKAPSTLRRESSTDPRSHPQPRSSA